MDAFEKLAKLAGASVESVGDGLPRTLAEALALGAVRYFTGKPCLHGHVAERAVSSRECCECRNLRMLQRNASPEGKEYIRQYNAKPEVKERKRLLGAAPKIKELRRLRHGTPEGKECNRQRKLAKTGDAALFAISQAEYAARIGRAAADIVHQCPEPQRSQLQALVDRIKADPQAGKAVVGLLQTMRELRKAELAEMKVVAEGGAA